MYLAFSKFSAGLWIGTVTGWKVRVSFSMSILNLIISSLDSSWNDRAYFSKDDKQSRKVHVYKFRPRGAWEKWSNSDHSKLDTSVFFIPSGPHNVPWVFPVLIASCKEQVSDSLMKEVYQRCVHVLYTCC